VIRAVISIFLPSYPRTLVYMLQSTEYQTGPYLRWFWRTQNFSTVIKRRVLEPTRPARMLLLAAQYGIGLQLIGGLVLIYQGIFHDLPGGVVFGLAALLSYPVVWAHLLVVPLILGREFVSKPAEQKLIEQSRQIFANHPGIKIAVAGSYGKTTMKELLLCVLSQGLNVAATPANKNVSSSHAYFARKLTGKEDVLILEYGEGAPGDIARFAAITQPSQAVITGLAPAHLDHYKTLEAAGNDIFSLATFVEADSFYVNADSPSVKPFLKPDYQQFTTTGALGWNVSQLATSVRGTTFTLTKGKRKLLLKSGLVGRHQAGFLAFAAALALELDLSEAQTKAGVAATQPFEHRMQPYELNGAWIIDDTYNGNLEGIRVGTQLLADLEAKRKIYVSPGLVDQGVESERVHLEMGRMIAAARPDIVVLMNNSATESIRAGLEGAAYKGELQIEFNPLEFYTNLKHFVASGDLVVMQNDWTDNYA
jgi:UDP-N-acetylmuramoyl-tripeptide--D-alanyl-D-alanine ligase